MRPDCSPISRCRRLRRDDRGSLTVFTAVLGLALLLMAGLVVDGTGKLRAARTAEAIAQEAARAGADSLNAAAARAGQPAVLDPTAAVNAADAYLQTAGVTGTAEITGPTEIAVAVTLDRPTAFLGLIGIPGYRVSGHAVADLEHGG